MRKWNTPVVAELDITATANGCFKWYYESCLTHGCSHDEPGREETPEEGPENDPS